MLKAVLMGTSLVGGLLAAHQSKSSRSRAEEQQAERTLDSTSPLPLNPLPTALPQGSPQTPTGQGAQQTQGTKPLNRFDKLQVSLLLLVLQALLSMALVARGETLRPTASFPDPLEWTQLLGILSLALLTTHAIAVAMLSSRINAAVPTYPALTSHAVSPRAARHHHHHYRGEHAALEPLNSNNLQNLAGVWIKDKQLSDSMDAACDLIELHGVVRAAISLLKGVEIGISAEEFRFSVLSGFLWFKVTERYPLNGEERKHRRRDLRGGGALGRVSPCPTHPGGIQVHVKFAEPYAGHVQERFYCPTPDLLHVDAVMTVRGRSISYRQVYRRKNKSG